MPLPKASFSGFPFDEADFGREDDSFKSHLDDLAKRHPEIAQHFNKDFDKFPFRSNTWGHRRRGSSANKDEEKPSSHAEDFPEFKHFAERPFASRFERFGFPFSRTFDGDSRFRQPQNQQQPQPQTSGVPQQQQQPQTSSAPHPQPSGSPKESQTPETKPQDNSEKPPQVPNQDRGRKQHPYVAQSNTADLGQKQEAVNEPRGQRSMSAPPENRSDHPRFVSSINIPINIERGGGGGGEGNPNMGSQQSQQQQPPPKQSQQTNQGTHERVIPIMVEGRDEPVVPKNVHQTFSPPPRPEPERIFTGQRPSQFAGWTRNDTPFFREPYYQQPPHFQQHQQPQQQYQQPQQQFQQPQQQYQQPQQQFQHKPAEQHNVPPQHAPQAQQQQPRQPTPPKQQEHSQTPPPPQKQGKLTPTEQIEAIQKDVADLMTKIENFSGKTKDKQYLYLDEMLTRNLIKLDDVQTEGQEDLRQMRKEAIRSVQRCISVLESKVATDRVQEAMDVEQKKEESSQPAEVSMEVEKTQEQVREGSQQKEENKPSEEQQVASPPNQEHNKPNEEVPATLEISGKVRAGSVNPGETKDETAQVEVANVDGEKGGDQNSSENIEGEKNEELTKDEKDDGKSSKDKKGEKKDKKKVKKKEKNEKK